jgi:hypothetical protein
MADTLRNRLAGMDYLVDEALPPVADLLAMVGRNHLAHWPPHTPTGKRLRPIDLPDEIARLKHLLARFKRAEGNRDSGAVGVSMPIAHSEIPMATMP